MIVINLGKNDYNYKLCENEDNRYLEYNEG